MKCLIRASYRLKPCFIETLLKLIIITRVKIKNKLPDWVIKFKKMANEKSTSGGIGFCGLLTIAFIVLKLCNVIAWSWLWVLSPSWIPLALVIVGFGLYLIYQCVKDNEQRKVNIAIKEIMRETGRSEYFARQDYFRSKGVAIPKSKWEQRRDEMMAAQEKVKAMRNN